MKPVFVDTSAFIALGNERDTFYLEAGCIRRNLVKSQRIFLTTRHLQGLWLRKGFESRSALSKLN